MTELVVHFPLQEVSLMCCECTTTNEPTVNKDMEHKYQQTDDIMRNISKVYG